MLATNKVSTRTAASITNQSATAGGALAVTASDAATIASNVKVVSNSVTTTDSGLHFLGKFVNGSVPATYTTASGSQTVAFGNTVRVVHGYATPRFTTDDPATVALKTGDRIRVRDGYAGGGDPGVYRYLGPDASLNPSAQDYSDAALWVLVAGADDVVYRYMGGTPVTLDLGATDYTDLRFWKPEQATQIVPINVNFDTSDSRAIAGAIVLNDVNGGATARIDGVTVSAGSVAVARHRGRDDRRERRRQRQLGRRQHAHRPGRVAGGGRRARGQPRPRRRDRRDRRRQRHDDGRRPDRRRRADRVGRGEQRQRDDLRRPVGRPDPGLQHDRLEARQGVLEPGGRRDPRRPGRGEPRLQRRAGRRWRAPRSPARR